MSRVELDFAGQLVINALSETNSAGFLRALKKISTSEKDFDGLLTELIEGSCAKPRGRFPKLGSEKLAQVFRAATEIKTPSEELLKSTYEYLKKGASGRAAIRAIWLLILNKKTNWMETIFQPNGNPPYFVRSVLKLTRDVQLQPSSDPLRLIEESERALDLQCMTRIRLRYASFFDEPRKKQKVTKEQSTFEKNKKTHSKKFLEVYNPAPGHEEGSKSERVAKHVRPGLRQKDVDRMSSREKQELLVEADSSKKGFQRGRKK